MCYIDELDNGGFQLKCYLDRRNDRNVYYSNRYNGKFWRKCYHGGLNVANLVRTID